MTLEQMRKLGRERITVKEAAEIIGCSPQRLRDGLDIDEERPVDMRRYLFPHCKVGNRHCIMREGFLRWVDGTMLMPDLKPIPDQPNVKELIDSFMERGNANCG